MLDYISNNLSSKVLTRQAPRLDYNTNNLSSKVLTRQAPRLDYISNNLLECRVHFQSISVGFLI